MSRFSIIRDTSIELRGALFQALTSAEDTDFGLDNAESDIVLAAPMSELPDESRLSIYLYHIEPDEFLRNQKPVTVGPSGLLRAPVGLRLRYLITPLGDEEDENQLMLGRIIQAFHDRPFIDRVAGAPLGTSFGGGSPELRISFETLSLESLSRIWHALNVPYRLSVAYLVRVAMVDSDLGPVDGKRVVEAHTAVEQVS
jgi:hypothetical protein